MAPPRQHMQGGSICRLSGDGIGLGGVYGGNSSSCGGGPNERRFSLTYRHKVALELKSLGFVEAQVAPTKPSPFSQGRSLRLPGLRLYLGSTILRPLILLLLLSGQCPNPGPLYPCGVCDSNVTWRGTSYLCTDCQRWVHARCSGLARSSLYGQGTWRCPVCCAGQASPLSSPSQHHHSPPASPTPNPGPDQIQNRGHFLQFNTNGILNSQQQLLQLLQDQNILIACIQETKLTETSILPPFPNYTTIRKDRPQGRGGGLITLIHHSVTYQEIIPDPFFPGDTTAEHLTISVEVDGAHLQVCNVYIPPSSSCPPGYVPAFSSLLVPTTGDVLIMGDFNAHDALWYSSTDDAAAANRGADIVEALDNPTLMVINQNSPTRVPSSGPTSSPDLTITNSHLGLNASWVPITTLNSDHIPILVDLDGWFAEPPQVGPNCYTNFRKANWDLFTSESENSFSNLAPPTSCAIGEKIFRQILQKASRRNIPRGKIPNFTQGLTQHAREMISERDDLRVADPTDPRISQLESRIAREVERRKQEIWQETVESCSMSHCSSKYFKILRDLTGKRSLQDPNQPITFSDQIISDKVKIATKFVKQFTRPIPHSQDPSTRVLLRHAHKRRLDSHTPMFSKTIVTGAIQACKNSTAPSADGLTILQLKHLGPLGTQYLTALYNLSYQHATLPTIWKQAIILPLLKPGKPRDQSTSYRPISLLCPASKVLEKLMLQRISPHLHLNNTQHGFRSGRSTSTALLPLVHQVASGFNQNCPPLRTVAMAVDFSKAFDTVNHTSLLRSLLNNSTLPPNDIRWLFTYLRGRTASCSYNRVESAKVILHQGVPQGSILSPLLFNFYVSSYPDTAQLSTSYADDFTACASHPKVEQAASTLARHAEDVADWALTKDLIVSTSKSTITLFTPEFQQSHLHPNVPLNGIPLPLDRNPKILGVTFDPHLCFHKHIESIVNRAKPRLNILKLLTGTDWGQQRETIVATFKSLIGSILNYAAPVWFPNTSQTSINRLQIIQNSALRIATGCVRMTPIDHLHTETKTLKVEEHLKMLCSQYLGTYFQPNHASFPVVTANSGPRRKKKTLQLSFADQVSDLLVDGCVEDIKEARKVIHTRAVEEAIASRGPNGVLGSAALDVDTGKVGLPRGARTTLAQLRSGYCSALHSFKHRIGLSAAPTCPCCRQADHTTQHLFSCPEHPTDLSPLDLWQRPDEAATFLRTWPCFEQVWQDRLPPKPPPCD